MRPISLPRFLACLLLVAFGGLSVAAQNNNNNNDIGSSPSQGPTSTSLGGVSGLAVTSILTTTLASGHRFPSGARSSSGLSGTRSGNVLITSVLTTVYPSTTSAPTPNSTDAATAASTTPPTASASPDQNAPPQTLPLQTKIDPAFGILGAVLILSGLPMAFWGHKNRWTTFFLAGLYSLALLTISIILKAGVEQQVNDPSKTVRGLFLLAALVAGAIGGVLCIVFWQSAVYLTAGLGGFVLGLFIQALSSDGVIKPIGFRFVLYFVLFAVAFALSCIPRIQTAVLLAATAITGASAFVLGVDCFTRVGLKEFYVHNLGFDNLFADKYKPTFSDGRFPLVVGVQIELGVIGAVTIMGIAFQTRLWAKVRQTVALLNNDDEDRRLRAKAERAANRISKHASKELEQWEQQHGYLKTATRTIGSPTSPSDEKDLEAFRQNADTRRGSTMSLEPAPARKASGDASSSKYAPSLESPGLSAVNPLGYHDSSNHRNSPRHPFLSYIKEGASPQQAASSDQKQAQGALPDLELGESLAQQVAVVVPTTNDDNHGNTTDGSKDAFAEQRALLEEIAGIRKSIEVLRSSSPSSPAASHMLAAPPPVARSPTAAQATEFANVHRPFSVVHSRSNSEAASSLRSASPLEAHARTMSVSQVGSAAPASAYTPSVHSRTWSTPDARSQSTRPSLANMHRHSTALNDLAEESFEDRPAVQGTYAPGFQPRSQPRKERPLSSASFSDMNSPRTVAAPRLPEQRPEYRRNDSASRRIVDTPQAAAARRASAMPKKPAGQASPWSAPAEVKKQETAALTLEELQARHKAKLARLQAPVTEEMKEAEALKTAKEQWEKKQRLERIRMIEREKAVAVAAAAAAVAAQPSTKTQASDAPPQQPEARQTRSQSLSGHLQEFGAFEPSARRQSGTIKAKQWRQSLSEFSLDRIAQSPSGPVSQDKRTRRQSSLGLQRPDATPMVTVLDQHKSASIQRQSLPGRPTGALADNRRHSALGLGEGSRAFGARANTREANRASVVSFASIASPGPGDGPLPTSPSRELNETDIRRIYEGAAGGRASLPRDASWRTSGTHNRELSETDRRRLSQGAGPGQNRRLSQPLLHFDWPALDHAQELAEAQQQQRRRS